MPIRPVTELVAEAKTRIASLTPDEARAKAEAGEALLVDIRDIRELSRAGRIPGAFHAPRGMLEFWIDPASPYHKEPLATDRTLVLFCASAWRSALAADALQQFGHDNVAEIEGGFTAWKKRGLPVETDDP
ncbi:rhodanese-like domain-containing protein [Psychromarinibacter sp. C21-152]|uniref:Rhodanese-like domain-containing protein n=1 Tax=Psychromarinibacter sediminicola TaxID=3033385 RepID=A0AAE3NS80_9RHOB|nr:rhodanese-like domain-containing protein [Psychromarinibacter sediminicola]MDF0600674.1 rhodanese-like domain-containing protein [Psychromarinibacter sediminicola]